MSDFAAGIERWVAKAKAQTEEQAKFIVLEMFTRVVMRTPRDTGRAMGNWNVSYGALPVEGIDDVAADAGHVESALSDYKAGGIVWLANGLPYIRVLEYGLYPDPPKGGAGKTVGGYSRRAVGGMVRLTVAEFGTIAQGVTG